MKIANDLAVGIHYTLTDDKGETLDSSIGTEPLIYLHGYSNIIPGLESELDGLAVGDKKTVQVQPADGYGEFDESLVQDVPREMFTGVESIEVGMAFEVDGPDGHHLVEVTKVAEETITIDGNHALAGKVLNFDVEVVEVRAATAEEIEHGHIHSEECSH